MPIFLIWGLDVDPRIILGGDGAGQSYIQNSSLLAPSNVRSLVLGFQQSEIELGNPLAFWRIQQSRPDSFLG